MWCSRVSSENMCQEKLCIPCWSCRGQFTLKLADFSRLTFLFARLSHRRTFYLFFATLSTSFVRICWKSCMCLECNLGVAAAICIGDLVGLPLWVYSFWWRVAHIVNEGALLVSRFTFSGKCLLFSFFVFVLGIQPLSTYGAVEKLHQATLVISSQASHKSVKLLVSRPPPRALTLWVLLCGVISYTSSSMSLLIQALWCHF